MQWANYWCNVIQCYRVVIEGWPDNFPFANLSAVSRGLPELENLLRKWRSGAIFWKHLTLEEFERLQKEHEEKINSGDIVERRRRPRSDKGKKRRREGNDESGHRKKLHKSAETVDTDSEEQPQDPTPPSTLPPPTQTMASDGARLLPPQTPTNVPEPHSTLPPPAQTSNTFPESDALPPPAQTPHNVPESEGALPSAQPPSYPPASGSALPPAHWTLNGATSSALALPAGAETLRGIATGAPHIDMDLI